MLPNVSRPPRGGYLQAESKYPSRILFPFKPFCLCVGAHTYLQLGKKKELKFGDSFSVFPATCLRGKEKETGREREKRWRGREEEEAMVAFSSGN